MKVGCRRWSATIFSGRLLARAREHPLHEVAALRRAAVQAVEPGGADDERAVAVGQRGVLAGELGERVDRARGGHVVLAVGLVAAPVEDVVGREVHEPRRAQRQLAHGADVDRPRLVGLGLAHVDVVERRAVEDDVGLDLVERAVQRRRVGDVELGVRERRARRRRAAPRGRRRAGRRRR